MKLSWLAVVSLTCLSWLATLAFYYAWEDSHPYCPDDNERLEIPLWKQYVSTSKGLHFLYPESYNVQEDNDEIAITESKAGGKNYVRFTILNASLVKALINTNPSTSLLDWRSYHPSFGPASKDILLVTEQGKRWLDESYFSYTGVTLITQANDYPDDSVHESVSEWKRRLGNWMASEYTSKRIHKIVKAEFVADPPSWWKGRSTHCDAIFSTPEKIMYTLRFD